jgi:HPt (histidine-containing phosphotransfer) domain-containing protein
LDPIQQNALNQALDRLWYQFLPLMEERIKILETAASAFSAKKTSFDPEQAANAAHKLAGVLGTFSLAKGTALARELEIAYSRHGGPDPFVAKRLASIASELRTIVANRK